MVGIITFACLLLSDLLTSLRFHDSNYYARNGWPKLAAFWLAAGIVSLMVPRHEDEVLSPRDAAARERPVLRERDSFLLIPVKYWPLVLLILGVAFYFVRD